MGMEILIPVAVVLFIYLFVTDGIDKSGENRDN